MDYMMFELLRFLLNLMVSAWDGHSIKVERRRKAKALLKAGEKFLKEDQYQEASIRFGAAMKLCPEVLEKLTNRKRQQLLSEIAAMPGEYSSLPLRKI